MPSAPLVLSRRPKFAGTLERGRLLDLCNDAPLLVLTAPAGCGKSVLASQLCDRSDRRVVWCRLAEGFADAADLVSIAGSATGDVGGVGGVASDVLVLAGELLELLESEPTTLVIDSYEVAEGDRCDQLLGEVAPLLPPGSALVVCSRTRPAALLGHLATSAPLVVESADLAFDAAEATALFQQHDREPEEAHGWFRATDGWATALAIGAENAAADPAEATRDVAAALTTDARLTDDQEMLIALAVLPYLTGQLVAELDSGSRDDLIRLGGMTSLVSDADGHWRLHPAASEAIAAKLDPSLVDDLRIRAARALAAVDPVTAIELFLEAAQTEEAAQLLELNLSSVTTDHALRWLYLMPADVRRRFPPALSAGRATVNLDAAIITARDRVNLAVDPASRMEALFALGSVHAGRGELGDAADALEAATRLAGDSDVGAIRIQLGLVRWWAGDLSGAAAVIESMDDGVWPSWIRGQLAILDGDADATTVFGRRCIELAASDPASSSAPGLALSAAGALMSGSDGDASSLADAAYRVAVDFGGLDLAAAAPIHGWVLIRSGHLDEARAVVDILERQVGRQDFHARVQAALLRRGISAFDGDTETRERDERRVHDLRQRGFATLEAAADLFAGAASDSSSGLNVSMFGELRIEVDGSYLSASAWKSKKALEVFVWLTVVGVQGSRREQVIEAVWPGRDPEKGRTLLRTALSEIRRVLEPGRQRGEPSRFLEVDGDRVVVSCLCDLLLPECSDVDEQFQRVEPGLADTLPVADWIDELRRDVERQRVSAAARLVAEGGRNQIGAFEVLLVAEPWNRNHVDGLMDAHRAAGDDGAASAVERRWFEDDG